MQGTVPCKKNTEFNIIKVLKKTAQIKIKYIISFTPYYTNRKKREKKNPL